MLTVRWCLRYGLAYRDIEELLAERGVEVDQVFRWVQRFTPLLADAARFARHSPDDRWYVDETYVKVNGVYPRYRPARAGHRHAGSTRRHAAAARRFFRQAVSTLKVKPSEVVTAAAVYPAVLDESIPSRGTTPSSTRTIRSRPIIAGWSTGCDRCAAYERARPRRSPSPDTPSCRTSAADTTNSDSTPHPRCESQQRSPNSLRQSEPGTRHGFNASTDPTTQQRPPRRSDRRLGTGSTRRRSYARVAPKPAPISPVLKATDPVLGTPVRIAVMKTVTLVRSEPEGEISSATPQAYDLGALRAFGHVDVWARRKDSSPIGCLPACMDWRHFGGVRWNSAFWGRLRFLPAGGRCPFPVGNNASLSES